jgi:threonine dehydrogenase-like Zn-dependent dehydrogenase
MYAIQQQRRDFDVAAELLATRPEIPETLISHRLPLDAAVDAFRIAHDRAAGAIKVVLEP